MPVTNSCDVCLGLSCVQAKEVKDKDWAQQSGKYEPHLQDGTKHFYKTCSMRIVC